MQQSRTRNARPYAGNGYFSDNCVKIQPNFAIPTVYLPMSFRPGAPVVSTRGEISLEVNFGFLSGRFLGYSLREFGLRRPLEMTYRGNVLKARNSMFWKCINRTKQQQFNVSTCRGLHCKPAVPTLFSCPNVDSSRALCSAPSVAHMGATLRS